MKKKFGTICALFAASLFCSPAAHAASLLNETLTVQYFYPSFDWMEQEFNYTVGASPDIAFYESLSGRFTESSFILFADQTNIFPAAPFNGIRIFDKSGSLADFSSVTLSGLSTLANFDTGRLSFDADNIYINLEGMAMRAGRDLILDIAIAEDAVLSDIPNAVPEPAAWMMMLSGFGLVGGAMRRRHQSLDRRLAHP